MEILEFGNKNNEKIILLHGLESPYQVWNKYIEHYQDKYHIIVPILEGHNPNIKEQFDSFIELSHEFEEYILKKYDNKIYAIYGMSMGGVLAARLWQNQKLEINKIIFESSPLISYNKLISFFLSKIYLNLTHKVQKRDQKTINKAINTIVSKDNLEEFLSLLDNITDNTIINYINEIGKYKLPKNIKVKNTKIYYYYGTKISELFARINAKYIKKYYSNAKIISFKGKGHCETSIMNPSKMIKELDKIILNKNN